MIPANLQSVRARIAAACTAAGRDVNLVTLLAVSKTFGAEAVQQAIAAGQTAFGENYIQEAVEKIRLVRQWEAARHERGPSDGEDAGRVDSSDEPDAGRVDPSDGEDAGRVDSSDGEDAGLRLASSCHSSGVRSPLAGPLSRPSEWHCIGPIQSNKTRLVAENFDWVHTVDRLKIAQRLSEQRPLHLPPLQVCIQVNIDGGPTKSGVAPGEALALAQAVAALPRLVLRGLMCIPDVTTDNIANYSILTWAKGLFDRIILENRPSGASGEACASGTEPGAALFASFDTLSMGMSGDLEAAVRAGSTMVRVGTAIFGGRSKAAAQQS